MDKKRILIWELIAIIFIIFLGSASHFFFEWSGSLIYIGLFSPVNESVWEHLKLTYWPLIIFCLIEYKFISSKSNNYFFAKLSGAILMNLIIISVFYSYTSIIGEELLIVDILSFIIAVIFGQFLIYKLMTIPEINRQYIQVISLIFLVIYGLVFIIFTFFPLELPIFLDSISGKYGIP
ncbi:MAG: hypothetical protein KGD63_02700 [Candidatus Lokiarchaeota archaeon]|nr:hypothetical protein [Candidatus Lokiarchaeota archaeon]